MTNGVSVLTPAERFRLTTTGRAGPRQISGAGVSFLRPAERQRLGFTGRVSPTVATQAVRERQAREVARQQLAISSFRGDIGVIGDERRSLQVENNTLTREQTKLNALEKDINKLQSSFITRGAVSTNRLVSEFNTKSAAFNVKAEALGVKIDKFNVKVSQSNIKAGQLNVRLSAKEEKALSMVETPPVKEFVSVGEPAPGLAPFGLETRQARLEVQRRQAELEAFRERPPPVPFGLEPITDFPKFVEERVSDIKVAGKEFSGIVASFKQEPELSEPVKFAVEKQIERGEFLTAFRTTLSGGQASTKREVTKRAKAGLLGFEIGAGAAGLGFVALGEPFIGALPEKEVRFEVPFFGERKLTKGGFRSSLDVAGQLAFVDATFRLPAAARGTKALVTGKAIPKALRLDQPIIDVFEKVGKRRPVEIISREFFEPIKGTEKTKVLGVGEAKTGFFKKQPFLFEAEISKPQKLEDIFRKTKFPKRKLIIEPEPQIFLSEKAAKEFSGFPSTFVKRGDIVQRVGFKKGFPKTPGVLDFDVGEVSIVVGKIRTGKPQFGSIFTDFAKGKAKPKRLKALLKEPEIPFSELQAVSFPKIKISEEAIKRGGFSKRFKQLFREERGILPVKTTKPSLLQLPTPERGLVISKTGVPIEQFLFFGKAPKKAIPKGKAISDIIPQLREGAGISFFTDKPSEAFTFLEIGKKGKTITIGGTEITKKLKGSKFLSIAQPLKRPITIKTPSREVRKLLGLDIPLLEAPELRGVFDFGKSQQIAKTIEKLSIRKDPFGVITPKAVQRFFEKRAVVAAEQATIPDLSKFLSPGAKGVSFSVPSRAKMVTLTKQLFGRAEPATRTGTITITKTRPAITKQKEVFGKIGQEFKRERVSEARLTKEFQRAFGIPKEAVRVRPTIRTRQAVGAGLISLTRQRIKQIPKEKQRTEQRLAEGFAFQEGFGLRFKDAQRFLEKTAERQRQRQAELFRFAEAQRFRQGFKEVAITKQKQIFKEAVIPKTPFKRLPRIPFLFPIPETKKAKKLPIKVTSQAFAAVVKKKGKLVKVSKKPLHKNTALALAVFVADNTAARTATIRKIPGTPKGPKRAKPSLRKFRNPIRGGKSKAIPNLFIERTKFAIDLPGEKSAITARGLEALRLRFFKKRKTRKVKRLRKK